MFEYNQLTVGSMTFVATRPMLSALAFILLYLQKIFFHCKQVPFVIYLQRKY
jgi:hypothetical protein